MIGFLRRKRSASTAAGHAGSESNQTTTDLLNPHVMDQIGHLELLSRTVVDGLLAGKHRSTTKGGCCEFAQHRQYAPGDEIRQIDWQVYARNDRYFIRQFEEETNLHGIVALDTSASMKFGHSTVSKLDYARQAAACLARLFLRQRDAVGAVILNEHKPLFVPPRQQPAHLKAVLTALSAAQPTGAGSLGQQIQASIGRLRRRGMFILFSDCFGDPEELTKALRIVRARGHDVVVMQVLAPEEVHFNFRHWSAFQSLEDPGQRLHLDPAALRHEYLNHFRAFLNQLETSVTGLGGDYVRMTTNHNLAEVLGWFLRSRMARV
ncbi:MAG: DUF58 domain-containing protein [Planctomycetaceae bacterium]|nr:DUF58 domain-containing protein [Planctomycetaceae bacterium]